jgi:hypothetical protein
MATAKWFRRSSRAENGGKKQRPESALAETSFPALAPRATPIPNVRELRRMRRNGSSAGLRAILRGSNRDLLQLPQYLVCRGVPHLHGDRLGAAEREASRGKISGISREVGTGAVVVCAWALAAARGSEVACPYPGRGASAISERSAITGAACLFMSFLVRTEPVRILNSTCLTTRYA